MVQGMDLYRPCFGDSSSAGVVLPSGGVKGKTYRRWRLGCHSEGELVAPARVQNWLTLLLRGRLGQTAKKHRRLMTTSGSPW